MATRFKLDENIPRDAIALLRDAGHDVQSALDEQLGGSTDLRILDACRNESRVLVTLDLDFSDIRLHAPGNHPGIWVLRPHAQSVASTISLMRGALALLTSETPERRLWIIEHGRVRIRD